MQADLYNIHNEKVGTVEVPDSLFSAKWRPSLVHQVLVAQEANKRRPWAHAKDRSEVRGGGRKPWRQKGTGRARHGSIRSPLWAGGGKAHGPRNERDYSQKVNKKMRRAALASVLSRKFKEDEVKFFEQFELEAPKTKMLAGRLAALLETKRRHDVVIVPSPENRMLTRAGRNLQKVKVLAPNSLNIRDLLNHRSLFIDQRALDVIQKQYASAS